MLKAKRKIWIFARWIVAVILVVIITTVIFLYMRIPVFLGESIKDSVQKQSDGHYHVAFDKININLLTGKISFSNFKLLPIEKTSEEISQFYIEAPEIRITGMAVRKMIFGQVLHFKKLQIINPEIQINGTDSLEDITAMSKGNLFAGPVKLFNRQLKQIRADNLEFINVRYGLSQLLKGKDYTYLSDDVTVRIKNLVINPGSKLQQENFHTDDIIVQMNRFKTLLGDSIHMLNIDSVKYSLKTSAIEASGFHLGAPVETVSENRYSVYVPQVFLRSKNLSDLQFRDSLNIESLYFSTPQISFYQKDNPGKLNPEMISNFDLYRLISNEFTSLMVDSFYFNNAHLEIYRQPDTVNYQHSFGDMDITLLGFDLSESSAKNHQKLLHADDIEIKAHNYHLRLDDNQHELKADSLFVSSITNSMGAQNISVTPVVGQKYDGYGAIIDIQADNLEIQDADLKKVYHTRILSSDNIQIIKPEVYLIYHKERKRQKKAEQDPGILFEMVTAYLKGVYSNLIFIDQGLLKLENSQKQKVQGYFETRFGFGLTDFSLDSASFNKTDKLFYASGFDLRFSDYRMKLADDLHKLNVDSIYISSNNQKIEVDNLHLQPAITPVTEEIMEQHDRSELYNISIPKINISKVNLRNAFFYKKLEISQFKFENPDIYLEVFNQFRNEKQKKELDELYQLILNYMTDFDVEDIQVNQGKITWVNHTRKEKTTSFDNEFSARLSNFRLNEQETDRKRLFFSDNFELQIKDQLFQLSDSVHMLKAGEIRLSSAQSLILVKDALLYPMLASEKFIGLPVTYQISLPELKVSDFDFTEAWYTRNLKLRKLDINNPRFQIYSQPGAVKSLDLKKYNIPLPAFIGSLKLGQLTINDGEVMTYEASGINHHITARFITDITIPGLTISKNQEGQTIINSGNLLLSVFKLRSALGKTHQADVEHISYNRGKKTIQIRNLNVHPFIKDAGSNQFNITIPEIQLSDFDVQQALEKNNYIFDKINIDRPQIGIEINDTVEDNSFTFLQTLDLFPYAEPYVDRIKVNQLKLVNAAVQFNWLEKVFINKEITFNFKNVLLASDQPPTNLLNSAEFEVTTHNLNKTSDSGHYNFSAGKFTYNSHKHSIRLDDIRINPLRDADQIVRENGFQTDIINGKTDYIEIRGIDEKLWLRDKRLHAEMLLIGRSELDIFRNKRYPFNENQRPDWPQDMIKKIPQLFSIDSIVLLPSNVRYSELLTSSDEAGFVTFEKLQFRTGRVTNYQPTRNLSIKASANLLGESLLKADIDFKLGESNYMHTIRGSLNQMPMATLNTMIEKAAPLSVETGMLTRLDFDIKLNMSIATGSLLMNYNDFKVIVWDVNDQEVRKSKFASFWANKVILNTNNPEKQNNEPASVYFERDPSRSIINYWWKSIYSGAKETLGID